MKKTVILFLVALTGCKTMTKSLVFGGCVGALTGAGLGGAVHYEDRKKGAILAGIVGAGIGAGVSYLIFKDRINEVRDAQKSMRESEIRACKRKISEAMKVAKGDGMKPALIPRFVPSQVKGGKLIGARIDWEIKEREKMRAKKEEK